MRAEVVTDQVPFGEGPVWCPDASLVCSSVSHGALYRVDVRAGSATPFVTTGGGANSAVLVDDGSFVVAQNGGIDLVASGHVASAPPVRWMTPGLQWAHGDGTVEYLTTEPMQAPNDLAVTADGSIYFTDPGPYRPDWDQARIMVHPPDGPTREIAGGYRYTNGIAVDLDGTSLLVVVDDLQLFRLRELGAGAVEIAVPFLGESGGDGLCLDTEGRMYVALRSGNAIGVFEAGGAQLELLELEPGNAFVTNCCFGGDDLCTLFATDARRGRVVAWEAMPTPGLAVLPWQFPGASPPA